MDFVESEFWGHSEGRCFTDDCANFMVKKSVWEGRKRQTDKDQLMDVAELKRKYV